MAPIHVRPAVLDDLDVVVRFNAAMALETEHLTLPQERLRQGVLSVLTDSSKGAYYMAELDGQVAGQLLLTYEWSDWRNGMFWWVQSVYVEPERRGAGVFRALYGHVEQAAHSRAGEVCGLRLYVERDNLRAQAVYERLGMRQTAYLLFEDDFVLGRGHVE